MGRLVRRYAELTRRALLPLLVLSGVLGVSVPFLAGEQNLSILGLYLAAPLVFAPVAFYLKSGRTPLPLRFAHPLFSFKSLALGYLLLQWISVGLLLVSEVRPTVYFVLVSLMSVVVLVQILYFELHRPRTWGILGEIGLILLNLVWGLTFNYYYFFGRSDVFPHVGYIRQLLAGHFVTGFTTYQPHPLWHILVAFETRLFGLPVAPRYVMFFTSGLIYFVGVVAIYAIARSVLSSERTALVAALFAPMSTWFVFYGAYSIPRSVVSILFGPLLLIMFKRGVRSVVLVGGLSVGIVMYHTVSGIFLIVILGVFLLLQYVFRPGNLALGVHHVATFSAVQLLYFLTAGRPTFEEVYGALFVAGGPGGPLGGLGNPVVELVNYLGFSVVIFFVLLGILAAVFSRDLPEAGRAVIATTVVLAPLSFPSPLQLTGPASSFNLLRFGEYTYPFISIAGAVGLLSLARARSRIDFRGKEARLATLVNFRTLVLVLVLTGAFLTVSNDWTASDNPIEKRVFYTFYFTESEVEGLETAGELAGGFVMTDAIACKYLSNSGYPTKCHILEVNLRDGELLASGPDDMIVVRDRELAGRPLQLFNTSTFTPFPSYAGRITYVSDESRVWTELPYRNKVYVSDSVTGYVGPSAR